MRLFILTCDFRFNTANLSLVLGSELGVSLVVGQIRIAPRMNDQGCRRIFAARRRGGVDGPAPA